jgi:hypothetical protein
MGDSSVLHTQMDVLFPLGGLALVIDKDEPHIFL